jgi:hypothetical protein
MTRFQWWTKPPDSRNAIEMTDHTKLVAFFPIQDDYAIRRVDPFSQKNQFNRGQIMPNVYVEPQPKGHHGPISGYKLEYKDDKPVTSVTYNTQEAAISAAKTLGHSPLIARVRVTSKGNPDHWRAA